LDQISTKQIVAFMIIYFIKFYRAMSRRWGNYR